MKKSIMFIIGLFLLSYLTINAQPGPGNAPHGRMEGAKKMLKLTPDQEKKFDDITYLQQKEVIDVHSKIQKNRLDLKKILGDNKIDEKAILQLVDETSKLEGDIKHSATKRAIDVYNILNDDQKPVWIKMVMRAAGQMNMMRGPGMMKGHGMMDGQWKHPAPDADKK